MNLEAFCAKEDGAYSRYYRLHQSFVQAGWRYYTDGRIAVAVPTTEPDTEGRWPTDMAGICRPPAGDLLPWPTFDLATIRREITCYCNGTGKIKCPDCNGTGESECPHCGQDMDCEVCDGKGEFKCDCNGQPQGWEWLPVIVGTRQINGGYAWLISQLPNARYCESAMPTPGCLSFTFDGGHGIVMPLVDVKPDDWRPALCQIELAMADEVPSK